VVEAFVQALGMIFLDPLILITIVASSIIAVLAGIIPGIGGLTLLILALPFIAGRDPLMCLTFMTVAQATSTIGGLMTAILVGVPGVPSNAADILDGFPMARQGKAARAIGAALSAAALGGIASVAFAFVMIPLVLPLLMVLKSPELFSLIVLGLTFLSVLTQGSPLKGLMSAFLGILFACIGFQSKTGIERFTFGNPYLYDGIEPVVMLMGLLALPVLVELVGMNKPITESTPVGTYGEVLAGVGETFKRLWLWFRCTLIGYVVGVIPGIGGETSVWVSYAHAKQTSKHPETFGQGNVEGVIAAQSAGSSRSGGDLLVTLAVGIPGSASMVLIMAAFILLGIQPGPKLLTEHTSLSFALLQIIAFSNVIAAIIAMVALPICIKITRVSPQILFCIIAPLIYVGVYVSNELMLNLIVMLMVMVLGILLRKYKYSIPSFILGFIMGRLFEYYLWQGVDYYGNTFFTTPISLGLLFLVFVVLTQNIWQPMWKKIRKPATEGAKA
jgi:TctA family transporter